MNKHVIFLEVRIWDGFRKAETAASYAVLQDSNTATFGVVRAQMPPLAMQPPKSAQLPTEFTVLSCQLSGGDLP